jgi:hypothetical protein
MWVRPWGRGESRVYFEEVDLSVGVDVLRATWEELNAAVVTFRTWHGGVARCDRWVSSVFQKLDARPVWDLYPGGIDQGGGS